MTFMLLPVYTILITTFRTDLRIFHENSQKTQHLHHTLHSIDVGCEKLKEERREKGELERGRDGYNRLWESLSMDGSHGTIIMSRLL
jgi:hypothetical protein